VIAERLARFFRNPCPFILLNLAFSTQAAYAAPLILLAQNTKLTKEMVGLTTELYAAICAGQKRDLPVKTPA
jgi:uncharacterized membrane protein